MGKLFATRAATVAMALGLCGGAVTAQTTCPVAADLEGGIRIEFEDGTVEVYSSSEVAGVTQVLGMDPFGYSYRMRLAHGTHLLMYEEMENGRVVPGSSQTYDYGLTVDQMPVPEPSGRWTVDVVATTVDGPREEAQTQAYSALQVLPIGSCRYDMIEAVIAYDTADFYIEGIHFLPELGIGYLAWSQSNGVPNLDLTAAAISTVR